MDLQEIYQNCLFIYPQRLTRRHKEYQYKNGDMTVKVKQEPNELFFKCSYSGFGSIEAIAYYVDGYSKLFKDFLKKLNGKKIVEIVVYFLLFNDNPLYMTIFLESDEYVDQPAINNVLNYRLGLKGDWEPASHYFYLSGELKFQAQRFDMLEFFEIDKDDKYYRRSRLGRTHPHIDVHKMFYDEFKVYKHTLEMGIRITKLFTYRDRILRNIIITEKTFNEIYVYYNTNDGRNNLPLLIEIHIGNTKKYFVNQGGNYIWKEETIHHIANVDRLKSLLVRTKKRLMGEVIDLFLNVPDYYKGPGKIKGSIFCQKKETSNGMGYTEYKLYREDNERFSISKFIQLGHFVVDFPFLPLYSILTLHLFFHKSHCMPLFICAVYDKIEEDIGEWYQLKIRNSAAYQFSYLLTEHPSNFETMWPIVKYFESKLYSVNFKTGVNLAQTKQKEFLDIDGVDFVKICEDGYTYKKHLFKPRHDNLFSVNEIIIYKERVRNLSISCVKEIHVLERRFFHFLLCLVKAELNYEKSEITESCIWFECYRPSRTQNGWKCIGPLNTTQCPNKLTEREFEQIISENKEWLDAMESSNNIYLPSPIDIPMTELPYEFNSYLTPPPLYPEENTPAGEYRHRRDLSDTSDPVYPTTTSPYTTSTTYPSTTTTGGHESYLTNPLPSVPPTQMSKLNDSEDKSSYVDRGVIGALFCITLMSTLALLIVYRENFSLNKKIKPLIETVKKFANPNR